MGRCRSVDAVPTWDEVPTLPGAPPGDERSERDGVVHVVDGLRVFELPGNGRGALVGWAFGPRSLRRFVDSRPRTVTISCERSPRESHPRGT